jgi:hypothetical protein
MSRTARASDSRARRFLRVVAIGHLHGGRRRHSSAGAQVYGAQHFREGSMPRRSGRCSTESRSMVGTLGTGAVVEHCPATLRQGVRRRCDTSVSQWFGDLDETCVFGAPWRGIDLAVRAMATRERRAQT